MKPVYQNKFGPKEGNCFAACIASMLEVPLEDVDFFAGDADWLERTNNAIRPYGYRWLEIDLNFTFPKYPLHALYGQMCVFTGKSPRYDVYHSVVGRIKTSAANEVIFEVIHDPHPEGGGICNQIPKLVGFFMPILAEKNLKTLCLKKS